MRQKDRLLDIKFSLLTSVNYLELLLNLKKFDIEELSKDFENIAIFFSYDASTKLACYRAFLARDKSEIESLPILSLLSPDNKKNISILLKIIIEELNEISTDYKSQNYSIDIHLIKCDLKILNYLKRGYSSDAIDEEFKTNKYDYLNLINDITIIIIKDLIDKIDKNVANHDQFSTSKEGDFSIDQEDSFYKFLADAKLKYFKKNIEISLFRISRHCRRNQEISEKNLKIISAKKLSRTISNSQMI
jgi:hypothetical protein